MAGDEHHEDHAKVLAAAIEGIQRARLDYPIAEHGKQQDEIWVSREDAGLFARAALNAISAAGFKILPKD